MECTLRLEPRWLHRTDRQPGLLRAGKNQPLGTSPCLQHCHLQSPLKPHWGLGQWLKLARVSVVGKALGACPSTVTEENTEKMLRWGSKRPQQSLSFVEMWRAATESMNSFPLFPPENSGNQETFRRLVWKQLPLKYSHLCFLVWHGWGGIHYETIALWGLLDLNENYMWGICFSGEWVRKFLRTAAAGSWAVTRSFFNFFRSYQGPALGAGISWQGAVPGVARLRHPPACLQKPSRNILGAENYEICTNSDWPPMGTVCSLLPPPSSEELHVFCLCQILALAFFPKTRFQWPLSHLTAKMTFPDTSKAQILLNRSLKSWVSQEIFWSIWVLLNVMIFVCLIDTLGTVTRTIPIYLHVHGKTVKNEMGKWIQQFPLPVNWTRANSDFHT